MEPLADRTRVAVGGMLFPEHEETPGGLMATPGVSDNEAAIASNPPSNQPPQWGQWRSGAASMTGAVWWR